jgi:hypothetical protein
MNGFTVIRLESYMIDLIKFHEQFYIY